MGGDKTLLISKDGRITHTWTAPPGYSAYWGELLNSGNLLLGCVTGHERWSMGGSIGAVVELAWSGEMVWQYENPNLHHDHCRLRNGNTLVLGRRLLGRHYLERIRGGLPNTEFPDGSVVCDFIREVTPAGKAVWEWHAEDALTPEFDILCPLDLRREWTHCNSVKELSDGNILVSFRNTSTVAIIQRESGAVSWRLASGLTSHQHDPNFLPNGNLLVFDNGEHRPGAAPRSRIIEIQPDSVEVDWEYLGSPEDSFFSPRVGGVQRLFNGNTLIAEGRSGRIFEVTQQKQIVWEYLNPFATRHRTEPVSWSIFRARHYDMDSVEISGNIPS
jgi:hypothetical protein